MKAMVLEKPNTPLVLKNVPIPTPSDTQVLIQVHACGICRTDLHIMYGELTEPKLPLIMGHQIVGVVTKRGKSVEGFEIGSRVGVPWLGATCRKCPYCLAGEENLCDFAVFTGYNIDGGFAEYCVADYRNIFSLPSTFSEIETAPLLCAGLIGFRALRFAEGVKKIGFYGFGSSAHILTQAAIYLGHEIYAFTHKNDLKMQSFAKDLGCVWAGDSSQLPPEKLDAAILFAPVGSLIPTALKAVRKGGKVISAGIHMSDIPSFPYSILWGERSIQSVANLTKKDGDEFLTLAPKVPIHTTVTTYPLEKTNDALNDLKAGKFEGSGVIGIEV